LPVDLDYAGPKSDGETGYTLLVVVDGIPGEIYPTDGKSRTSGTSVDQLKRAAHGQVPYNEKA
jgi:hypothetical protein